VASELPRLPLVKASDVTGKEEDFENRLRPQPETRHAAILSWSCPREVFVGISLTGATLWQDMDDNGESYGGRLDTKAILNGDVARPTVASGLISVSTK